MTSQPSTRTATPADAWLEPTREPALAPWWLQVGPGTPLDDVPDLEDVWLDLWPAPKEPWRKRALGALVPTVVLVLITSLLVGMTAYAYRAQEPRDRTYLPGDGAYSQITLNGTAGQLEQGVTLGSAVVLLGVIGAASAPEHLDEWAVDHDLWIAEARTASSRLRAVFVVDQSSISLLGVLTDDDVAAFEPALPVSRGAESAPRSESVSGQVTLPDQRIVPYDAVTMVRGDGGCMTWSATVTTRSAGIQPLTLDLRACRGSGVQALGVNRDGRPDVDLTVTGSAAPAGAYDGSITTAPVQPGAVSGWTARHQTLQSRDAAGVTPIFPVVNRQPVMLPDNRFVLINHDNSLTAYLAGQQVLSQWTAYPGGRVSHLIAAGSLLVAATDQRRLVAYDGNGFRVWQVDLPDLVGDLAVVGDRLIVSVFTGVVLSLDLRTGHEQWRQQFDSTKASPGLAASSDLVAFAEGDSTVHALGTSDGADQGDTGGATIEGLAVQGRTMILLRSDRLLGVDTADGGRTVIDIDTATGISPSMAITGTAAVVQGTDDAIIDLSATKIVGRVPAGAADLAVTDGAIMITRLDGVVVITPQNLAGTAIPLAASAQRGSHPDAAVASWGAVVLSDNDLQVIQ